MSTPHTHPLEPESPTTEPTALDADLAFALLMLASGQRAQLCLCDELEIRGLATLAAVKTVGEEWRWCWRLTPQGEAQARALQTEYQEREDQAVLDREAE